jgi:multiple sugar transport system permease protein
MTAGPAFPALRARDALDTGWLARLQRVLPGYLFVAPALSILGLFVFLPLVTAVGLSFTSWNAVGPVRWAGLRNYELALADPTFAHALLNTLVYTAGSATLGIIGALGLALLLNAKVPGIGAFRAVLFLPALMSEVVSAMVFQWLYSTDLGLLNWIATSLGFAPVPWLTSTHCAMLSVILMGAWVGAAYNAPIFLTGLQAIPPALYEAAALDGATPWQEFRHITLPALRPFMLYVLVMSGVGSFQVFGRIHVLTGGGPVDATLTCMPYIHRVAFSFNQMGYASALSVLLFLLLVGLSALQMKLMGEEGAR